MNSIRSLHQGNSKLMPEMHNCRIIQEVCFVLFCFVLFCFASLSILMRKFKSNIIFLIFLELFTKAMLLPRWFQGHACCLTQDPPAFYPLFQYSWHVGTGHAQWAMVRAESTLSDSLPKGVFCNTLSQQIKYLTWQTFHFIRRTFKILTLSLYF